MSDARTSLWEAIAPVHAAIMRHPFVEGMTSGELPADAFARYIVQDALYLSDYARALALCGARAADTPTLRMFCAHAGEAVEAERALQDGLLAELGVAPSRLAAATPTPTTRAYGDFLLRACAAGERHEALGAIVPCYWIYAEVGRHLVAAGSPDPRYQRWIDLYGGDEFTEAAEGAIAAGADALADLGPAGRRACLAHAHQAAVYEWLFWDAAWRDERWPEGLEPVPLPGGP